MRVPAGSHAEPSASGAVKQGSTKRLPWGYLIGAYIRFYGFSAWYSDSWPTEDKIVPFKLFALLSDTIQNLQAAEQLSNTHATAHAIALAMGGSKDMKLKRFTREQIKRAFPEIDDG